MFITVWIVSTAALSRGFLDERLNIYQYTNEQAMLEFTYDFVKDSSGFLGVYPFEFERLFRVIPDLNEFELLLAQGRWNENFAKGWNG